MIDRFKKLWVNFKRQSGASLSSHHITSSATGPVQAKSRYHLVIAGLFLGLVIIIIKYQFSRPRDRSQNLVTSSIKLQVASQSLDAEKMWRNHFEDKLNLAAANSSKKLQLIEASLDEHSALSQTQLKTEIDNLKTQIQFMATEQASQLKEFKRLLLNSVAKASEERAVEIADSQIMINSLDRAVTFDRPKSARHFIPETAYLEGILLGGIAVSTSMGSAAEPVPVIIRITGTGNLPKNFNTDLTCCQIMGSSYGDLSSERAIIRAETLSCRDPANQLIYTTKIVGLIYGDDGINGIKGQVVQTSSKHLKNALLGSMITGFASSAKSQESLIISNLGTTASTKQYGAGQMLQEGALSGASSAAEKIADYYIKQAEAMSPVLLIPGGTKVDVVFTKGVYFGALDVQEKLIQQRSQKSSLGE